MKELIASAMVLAALSAPASAGGLTATVTHAKPAYGDKYSILVVVDNQTNDSFKWTQWSCIFYSNGQIVGQDRIYVDNNESGKQSAKSTYVKSFKPFDKSECRLTETER